MGEFEGPLYFKINQVTGQVSVARDLTEDLDRFYNVSFYVETGCLKLTTLLVFKMGNLSYDFFVSQKFGKLINE